MTPQEFKEIREKLKTSRRRLGLKLGRSALMILNYEQGKYPIPKSIELCMLNFSTNYVEGK